MKTLHQHLTHIFQPAIDISILELIEAPNLEIEDSSLPFDWTENLTSKSIFIQNMDGIKDDHLLEDFVKRQIEKSDEIQAILTKSSLAQVNPKKLPQTKSFILKYYSG